MFAVIIRPATDACEQAICPGIDLVAATPTVYSSSTARARGGVARGSLGGADAFLPGD
jgi:hypothetical protein